jgi:hypothetical protein
MKGLAGATAATGANVAIGGALRKFSGQDFLPTVEQLTQDALFGAVHGATEARKAISETKPSTEEPTNAEQISTAGTPDGGVRAPEIAVQNEPLPTAQGSEGIQPSRQGEGLVEQPRSEAPPTIEDAAAANGVKFDARTELPGNPYQFTDERTGSTIYVLGDFTPSKLEEKVAALDARYGLEPRQRKLGPGAANIEEFAPQATVGAKNASVDQQRIERGLPPLLSEARKADEVTWANVEKKVEADPEFPARVVEEINSGEKKSATDEEQAALLWRMVDLRNKRAAADQRAADENTYTPEERADFEQQANSIESELQRTEEADRALGTKTARALRIRRLMSNEDYSLAAMERRARKAKGDVLTPDERAKIQQQSEEIQQTEKAFEERTAKLEEEDAGKAVDETLKGIETEAAKDPEFTPEVKSLADRIIARLDRAADAALRRLRAKGFALGSAPDPTIAVDVVIYGAAKIGKGVVKFSRWAAEMVKDLGEGVKPYLQDAWKQIDKNIDDSIAAATPDKAKRATVRQAVTKENATAIAEGIGTEIKSRISAGEKLTDLRGTVNKLVETLVRGGVKGRDAIVDAVHEVLKQSDPAITRRQTMDLISGYGDFKPLNADAVKAEVRDIKGQLQQIAKLEDIQGKKPLLKTGVERKVPSDEERRLIQQVNEAKRRFGVVVTDSTKQLKSALDARKTYYRNRMSDLQAEIAAKERNVKTAAPSPTDAALEKLKAEYQQVKADHDALFQTDEIKTAKQLNAYKAALERRSKDLQQRLAKGDFAKRERKPVDISKDPEAVRLRAENERLKKEFAKARFEDEQRKRKWYQKGWDALKETLASTRTLMTSLDVSAPLRQGAFLLIGDLPFHPIRVAKQIGAMFRQLASEKSFREAQAAISLRPNAPLYKQSKLYFSEMDGKLSEREESMRGTLAEKIPGIGRLIRGSNRAYSGFLNRQRADSFDALVEAAGGKDKITPEMGANIANAVNVFTGRGSALGMERAANWLARFVFSPRFTVSRFETALGAPIVGALGKGGARERAVIARQYVKLAAGLGALYGLWYFATGKKTEKDPRSSDFGKLRIGHTRIDPLGGLAQAITLMGRTVSGKTKNAEGLKPVTADTYYNFVRGKLAPVPGALLDLRVGKNVVGEKVTPGSTVQGLTVPLGYQDAGKVYQAHGPLVGTAINVLNLLGAGVQTHRR